MRMAISLQISYRGVDPSPAVDAAIRDWVGKLERVYDKIIGCDVMVDAPHRRGRKGTQYHVRVALTVPEGRLVVSRDPGPDEAHEDVYVAVRDSFHTARRQLEDHVRRHLLRKVKVHHEPPHARVSYLDDNGEWGLLGTAEGERVYFHKNSVLGGIERLAVGDEVRFSAEAGEHGPQASTVERVGIHGHHHIAPER
jgi:cold shock CspA family protein